MVTATNVGKPRKIEVKIMSKKEVGELFNRRIRLFKDDKSVSPFINANHKFIASFLKGLKKDVMEVI